MFNRAALGLPCLLALAALTAQAGAQSPTHPRTTLAHAPLAAAPAPTFSFERFGPVLDPDLDAPMFQPSVVDIDGDGDEEVVVDELDWRDPTRPWADDNVFVPHPVWVFDYVNGVVREVGRTRLPKSVRMTWIQDMARAADFNGDGKVDLFIGESGWDCCIHPFPGGPSAFLSGKRNGKFRKRKTPGDDGEFTHDVCQADFNGDGLQDMLLMNFVFEPFPGQNRPGLWMSRGKKGFANESPERMPAEIWESPLRYEDRNGNLLHSFGSCAPYDLDRDGDLDLLIGGSNDSKNKAAAVHPNGPWALINDGEGRFTLAPEGTFPESRMIQGEKRGVAYHERLYRADLDGDGAMEIVISRLSPNRGNQEWVTAFSPKVGTRGPYLGWKDVTSRLPECVTDGPAKCGFYPAHLVLRDLNGDGAVEMLLAGSTHKLYLNDGNGHFPEDITSRIGDAFPGGSTMLDAATFADLDGDGRADLFTLQLAPETRGDSRCRGFDNQCFRPVILWNRTGSQ